MEEDGWIAWGTFVLPASIITAAACFESTVLHLLLLLLLHLLSPHWSTRPASLQEFNNLNHWSSSVNQLSFRQSQVKFSLQSQSINPSSEGIAGGGLSNAPQRGFWVFKPTLTDMCSSVWGSAYRVDYHLTHSSEHKRGSVELFLFTITDPRAASLQSRVTLSKRHAGTKIQLLVLEHWDVGICQPGNETFSFFLVRRNCL